MGNPAHRRGGRPSVSLTLVAAVLVAFGLGWLGAVVTASASTPAGRPSAGALPSEATPAPPPAPATTSASSGAVVPVGFAQPAVTPNGLEVISVVTKIKGGVDLTFVAQNRGERPVTVNNADIGPGAVTFRGAPVPMEMAHLSKKLAPGEALVYSCRVKLPDMNSGDMSFTVAGVPVSGQAAGD
jgi:hypothetical protein